MEENECDGCVPPTMPPPPSEQEWAQECARTRTRFPLPETRLRPLPTYFSRAPSVCCYNSLKQRLSAVTEGTSTCKDGKLRP